MLTGADRPTPTHVEAEPAPAPSFPVFVSREDLEGWALGVAMVFCDAVEWWAQFLPERR